MRTCNYLSFALTLTAALSVLPARANPQTSIKASGSITVLPRADVLEIQATALHDQLNRYSEAARLHKASAALRSVEAAFFAYKQGNLSQTAAALTP